MPIIGIFTRRQVTVGLIAAAAFGRSAAFGGRAASTAAATTATTRTSSSFVVPLFPIAIGRSGSIAIVGFVSIQALTIAHQRRFRGVENVTIVVEFIEVIERGRIQVAIPFNSRSTAIATLAAIVGSARSFGTRTIATAAATSTATRPTPVVATAIGSVSVAGSAVAGVAINRITVASRDVDPFVRYFLKCLMTFRFQIDIVFGPVIARGRLIGGTIVHRTSGTIAAAVSTSVGTATAAPFRSAPLFVTAAISTAATSTSSFTIAAVTPSLSFAIPFALATLFAI